MGEQDLREGAEEVIEELQTDDGPGVVDGMAMLELLCQMEDIEALRE